MKGAKRHCPWHKRVRPPQPPCALLSAMLIHGGNTHGYDVSAAAGRATVKAAGVVVDDAAVTPQYLHGVVAERELAIVKQIALGSIRNKLLFILPAALLLNHFLPGLLPIILMIGGTYLAFEGAEKVWHKLSGQHAEKKIVSGAIRTDLILSAEIMVIALATVSHQGFWSQLGQDGRCWPTACPAGSLRRTSPGPWLGHGHAQSARDHLSSGHHRHALGGWAYPDGESGGRGNGLVQRALRVGASHRACHS